MNARSYRADLQLSPLDFPSIVGLGSQVDFTKTDPPIIIHNKIKLLITKKLIITESNTNKEHEVFTMQSRYEIPMGEIKTRGDVYEFYEDATLGLSEAYQFVQKQLPQLPNLKFEMPKIDTYKIEIDAVLRLLNSCN